MSTHGEPIEQTLYGLWWILTDGGGWAVNGRGRSRTYRGHRAPSNGFEVRASHRARYSSKTHNARALGLLKDLPDPFFVSDREFSIFCFSCGSGRSATTARQRQSSIRGRSSGPALFGACDLAEIGPGIDGIWLPATPTKPKIASTDLHIGRCRFDMTRLSYVHGASDTPFIGDTIGVHFDGIAERFAERDALIVRHQQVRWTYRELKEQVDAFAGGLLALGLKRGDRVGVWSPNNAEWVIAQFATAKAGLILVNINPAYRLAELEYALNKAGCVALITTTQFKTSNYLGMLGELAPELACASAGNLHAARLPELRLIIAIDADAARGTVRFADVCHLAGDPERHRLAALAEELQFDNPINIQFTSGTTGFPKGATLSHTIF